MEILLTTPYNPGDLDPGKQYDRARVATFSVNPNTPELTITVEYGRREEEAWVSGKARRRILQVTSISTPSYEAIVSLPSLEHETFGSLQLRAIYSAVQTAWPEFAGVIG